jgi:hypothetical protein
MALQEMPPSAEIMMMMMMVVMVVMMMMMMMMMMTCRWLFGPDLRRPRPVRAKTTTRSSSSSNSFNVHGSSSTSRLNLKVVQSWWCQLLLQVLPAAARWPSQLHLALEGLRSRSSCDQSDWQPNDTTPLNPQHLLLHLVLLPPPLLLLLLLCLVLL